MADEIMKAGRILRVTMEVLLPVDATMAQAQEWLEMEVGQFGSIGRNNPLIDQEPEAWRYDMTVEDTGMVGREERSEPVTARNGHTYRNIRYVREWA
jgi:hypothetical protein